MINLQKIEKRMRKAKGFYETSNLGGSVEFGNSERHYVHPDGEKDGHFTYWADETITKFKDGSVMYDKNGLYHALFNRKTFRVIYGADGRVKQVVSHEKADLKLVKEKGSQFGSVWLEFKDGKAFDGCRELAPNAVKVLEKRYGMVK
jgi:hypothetical protein